MLLYELHGPEQWDKINKTMRKAGYTELGSGVDSTVWGKDEGRVIKILMPESGDLTPAEKVFLAYYETAQKYSDNPHMMKFVPIGGQHYTKFDIGGETFYQIAVEKLQPLPEGSIEEAVVWAMSECVAHRLDWQSAYKQLTNPNSKIWQYYEGDSEAVAKKIAGSKRTTLKYLYLTMQLMYHIGRKQGFGWDLHTENAMLRNDGTIVITDPWYSAMLDENFTQAVAEGKISVKLSPGKGNGLFATKSIKAGEVITRSKFVPIDDQDWNLIKNTTPVKLYGFKLGDQHALQPGPFKFQFKDPKEKALWNKTKFKDLSLSGFMFINGADSPDEVNSEEKFSGNSAEMIATRDIQPGEEIIKQYNVPTTDVAEGQFDSLVKTDQAERNAYQKFVADQAGGDWSRGAALYAKLKDRPADDIFGDDARLQQFMRIKFDFGTFTKEDWHDFWLLSQHADKYPDFQNQALSAIKKHLGQNNDYYRYLADRISCARTGQQKYGTQDICKQQGVAESLLNENVTELYHGTLAKNVPSILANGLNPTVGEFTRSIYANKAKPLVFAADASSSRGVYCSLVGQMHAKLGITAYPPSAEDVAKHCAILVISKDVGKFRQYNSTRRSGSKEPTDYTSQETIHIDRVITGKELLQWIKTHNADRGEMCPIDNQQGVAEAFDKPYKGKWEHGDESHDMLVKLPDGSNLSIMFSLDYGAYGDEEWTVEFWRNNSQDVTGEGDQQRIFATVLNAIQKFIKKYHPERLRFSANKAVEPGQKSMSRTNLYNRLVQRYANSWGYEVDIDDFADTTVYNLYTMNEGVAEGTLNEIYKMPPTKNSSQGLAAWAYHDAVEKNSKIIFQDSNTIVFQVGADMIRYIILSQGKPILYLGLTKFLDGWKSGVVAAELEARGQGLATKIYLQASDLLKQPIYSDTTQTDASRLGIWNKLIQMVPNRVVGFDQKTNNDLPITMTKDGPVVNQNQPLYIDRNKKDSEKPVTQQQRYRTRILKLLPNKQGVAEDLEQQYLWHGSRQKIPMLEPRQAVDIGGAAGSNQNAIYATLDPIFATQMGMPAAGSDYGHFPNDPQMVLFSGKIRKGENVYLHKLPMNGPDGKPQFVQGAHDREFYSKPGVKGIKPIEIKAVPVNKYLNLIRKATPADLKLRKELTKEGVAERKISEINATDELTVPEELVQRFTTAGWQIVGEGRDQIVLGKPNSRYVLKIVGQGSGSRIDQIRRYIDFYRQNQQNPHWPRVGGDRLLKWGDKTYYAYTQEKLQHLPGDEAVLDYLEYAMEEIGHGREPDFAKIPPGLSARDIDGLINAVDALFAAGIGDQYQFDLSNVYNIMQRDNGQLVIVDPFAGWDDEELTEKVNPEILKHGYTKEKNYGNIRLVAQQQDLQEVFPSFVITAYDNDKKIAAVRFSVRDLRRYGFDKAKDAFLVSANTKVDHEYRKQGIAKAMYDFARELGNDIQPSEVQTDDGRKMWARWKEFDQA